MADVDATTASWIQAGGVLAFAGAVLWELRQLRPLIAEVRQVLASLLERERMRAEQRAQLLAAQAVPNQVWDDETDAIAEPLRRHRTPPRGGNYGPIRPRSSTDE